MLSSSFILIAMATFFKDEVRSFIKWHQEDAKGTKENVLAPIHQMKLC